MPDWVSKRNLDITAEHPFAGGSYTNGEYEVCGVIPDLPADLPAVRPRPDLQRRYQESGQDPGAGLMWG